MTPKPTDEAELRREIGRILNPGPWAHRWMDCSPNAPWCLKCRKRKPIGDVTESATQGCPIPDPFGGPLEVAAELLLRKVLEMKPPEGSESLTEFYGTMMLDMALIDFWRGPERKQLGFSMGTEDLHRWWKMSVEDRCRVLLKAKEKK